MGAAIDYLEKVGLEAIAQHEHHLTVLAHRGLEELGGVRFLGPSPEQKAGIVSFTVEGIHSHDVAQLLDRHGVAVRAGHHCAMPLHRKLGISASSRASFYLYNTTAEVDAFIVALRAARKVFRRR